MNQEQITSMSGSVIYTTGGRRVAIGNADHKVGDWVWVDSGCVFGHRAPVQKVAYVPSGYNGLFGLFLYGSTALGGFSCSGKGDKLKDYSPIALSPKITNIYNLYGHIYDNKSSFYVLPNDNDGLKIVNSSPASTEEYIINSINNRNQNYHAGACVNNEPTIITTVSTNTYIYKKDELIYSSADIASLKEIQDFIVEVAGVWEQHVLAPAKLYKANYTFVDNIVKWEPFFSTTGVATNNWSYAPGTVVSAGSFATPPFTKSLGFVVTSERPHINAARADGDPLKKWEFIPDRLTIAAYDFTWKPGLAAVAGSSYPGGSGPGCCVVVPSENKRFICTISVDPSYYPSHPSSWPGVYEITTSPIGPINSKIELLRFDNGVINFNGTWEYTIRATCTAWKNLGIFMGGNLVGTYDGSTYPGVDPDNTTNKYNRILPKAEGYILFKISSNKTIEVIDSLVCSEYCMHEGQSFNSVSFDYSTVIATMPNGVEIYMVNGSGPHSRPVAPYSPRSLIKYTCLQFGYYVKSGTLYDKNNCIIGNSNDLAYVETIYHEDSENIICNSNNRIGKINKTTKEFTVIYSNDDAWQWLSYGGIIPSSKIKEYAK